jgi:hypothetical protein
MDIKHIIVLAFMTATFLVMLTGVGLMMKGGPLNAKYGNKLMVARVGLQALTLLMLGVLFTAGK